MHIFFNELSVEDIKELFYKIITKEIYRYTPHYSGSYYQWTDLEIDNKNNNINVCKNDSHDYSCVINTEKENIKDFFEKNECEIIQYIIKFKDRLSINLINKINKYFITNNFDDMMKEINFDSLSEDRKKMVSKLIEELGCSINEAMFWLKFYSWNYDITKKYLSSSKSLANQVKQTCENVASEINKLADKGLKATIRPTDEAVKKVNEMAEKFKTSYNSIVDSLKENDWSFEKVEKIFSDKQKEENNNLTVSFEAKVTFDDLIKKLSSLPSDAKIKIVKEIFASENEAFVKKLIKEMLLEQL